MQGLVVAATASVLADGAMQVRNASDSEHMASHSLAADRPGQQLRRPGARDGVFSLSRACVFFNLQPSSPPPPPTATNHRHQPPPPPTTAAQVACMPAHDVCTQVVAGGTMQLAVFEAARAAASSAARALHSLLRSRLLASIKPQS